MKRSFHIGMTLGFVVYIGGFFTLQLLGQDKTFSDLENRPLAGKPVWSEQNFFNGKYGKDVEKYIADQFPLRNQFIALKSHSELMLQKKENNGVYIGADDYFLQKFETPNQTLMEKNIGYINRFAESFEVYFMLVPTATKIYEEKLPSFAQPYDEKAFIEEVTEGLEDKIHQIDVCETLQAHKKEDIYYKTDHHWTTLGAYYGYEAFCKSYGIEPMPLSAFERVTGSQAFYGSLFSKGNFTFAKPDTLELFIPKQEESLDVYYMGSDKHTDSLYEMSHLDKKDKYSVFLDNNHPIIQIKTGIQNGKKLALVKDSYANALIPFLTQHFEEIHVLDLRFLNMPIANYMRTNDLSDVLLLYNVQNFATVNQFSLLGK